MLLTLPRALEIDIMNFCSLNKIENVNDFLVNCLRDGYNIMKYGTSPQDNFNKENKPLNIEKNEYKEESNAEGLERKEEKRRGRPRKETAKKEEGISGEKNEEIVKPKKKIRIIKS